MLTLAVYSLRNLWMRRMTTLLTAGGMGLVVFVFATVLMLAEGLERTLVTTGSGENAVFIRRASEAEVQSVIPRHEAPIIEDMADPRLGPDGVRYAARELVVLIGLKKKGLDSPANVLVRGVTPSTSLGLRHQIRVVAGRTFQPGTTEVLVGKNIVRRFDVGGLGDHIHFGGRSWTIVGIMDAGGTAFDSEVWGDVDLLMMHFRRPVYSSVIVKLNDPSQFPALRERVLRDPRLTVDALREPEYYAAQSRLMARFVRVLGITLTFIFSLGAVIGSMVTMYAAVANRVSEIGTLRALGFLKSTILATFMTESVLLSLLGGGMGLTAASFMDRLTISTMNWQTFSELAFRFVLNRHIVTESLVFAMGMGLVGGLFPAIRASRMEIVEALRVK
ncbi:MAG: ABC transporter permease [Syntrophobacteraceae bacterium]|jgi:ABC-type lipoprotein release transport system permease subunit|nr:ABC transporter permease [Syntrophobacteraceae bacterium]